MRLDYTKTFAAAREGMLALQRALDEHPLTADDRLLVELVKIRVSQINGCGFCVHMHTQDALEHGENPIRPALVAGFREAPAWFSPREMAALAWAEQVTRIADSAKPDDAYAALAEHFSDEEIAALNWTIAAINTWNRVTFSFGVHAPAPRVTARA